MNRSEISTGAYISDVPGDKFKRCKFAIHLVVPSKKETATAMALLPHLLDRRCAAIPNPMDLSRKMFSLYGADIASESYVAGANRVITIGMSGLKNAYALNGEDLEQEYIDLACNLLFRPFFEDGLFASEDVNIEKNKQAEYLKSEMNDKRDYCLRQARRKLYKDSVLGIESSGYLNDIDALSPQTLTDIYYEVLSQAQIEVVTVSIDSNKAAQTIATYLTEIKRTPVQLATAPAIEVGGAYEHIDEPMDTVQGKLCILCPSGKVAIGKEFAAIRVATAIFGGLATSRLFTNVREKQSLCYYCASSASAFSGVLCIDSGVDHSNAAKAATAILHELDIMQKEEVSDDELENAKTALTGVFTNAKDNPDTLANWAFTEWLRGTNYTLEEFSALVQDVTKQEVLQAMSSYKPALEYVITQKEAAK